MPDPPHAEVLGSGFQVHYLSTARPPPRWDGVLGVATFVCELGSAAHIVLAGHRGPLGYRATSEVLFGSITLPERPEDTRGTGLSRATLAAYAQMLAITDAAGYPHLVRVWNYLGAINIQTHGVERYRQFNSAWQRAFTEGGRAVTGGVPAACALGTTAGSPLVIYFIASRSAPVFIENPRQVSAYHYPPRYGAHSPVFSRAAVLPGRDCRTLFISGTQASWGTRRCMRGCGRAGS